MRSVARATIGMTLGAFWALAPARAAEDVEAGAKAFGACAACHSLQAGRNMTGPTLAGVVGRKAGTVPGFDRYSPALKSAGVTWDETSLDAWLADPKRFVPGNYMAFAGIKDQGARADLIAFLKAADGGASSARKQRQGGGMMGGGADGSEIESLKELSPEQRVAAIRYCGATYRVTTAKGELPPFWEGNLRFKSDSSDKGPAKGRPALLPGGMMGDRAFVVFSDPAEISSFVERTC